MESRKNTIKALSLMHQDLQVLEKGNEVSIFGLTTVNIEKILKNRRSLPKNTMFSKSLSVSCFNIKNHKDSQLLIKETQKLPKKFSEVDWNDFLKRK